MGGQEGRDLGFAAPLHDFGDVVDLDGVADAAKIFPTGLAVLQGERDGVDAGLSVGLRYDQPSAGTAAHLRDRVIFKQPDRFPQRGPAHPVPFEQRRLGSEDGSDLPAAGGDLVTDGGRQHLGQFAARCFAVESRRPARILVTMMLLQPGGHRFNMSLAQCLRTRSVARGDRGDDLGVIFVHVVDRLNGLICRFRPRFACVSCSQPHQDINK